MWVKRLSIKIIMTGFQMMHVFIREWIHIVSMPNPNGRLIGINIMKTIFPTNVLRLSFFVKSCCK